MKYQFYAIVFDVAGNQVSSKSAASPLSITTSIQLVTSVSISPNAAQTKNIGETFTITPTVGPSNANNKNVNWASSNTSVATVSATATPSGTAITVTCKAAGTATITATAADGSGKSASCNITVIGWYSWADANCSATLRYPSSSSNPTVLSIGSTSTIHIMAGIGYNGYIPQGATVTITYTGTRTGSYYFNFCAWCDEQSDFYAPDFYPSSGTKTYSFTMPVATSSLKLRLTKTDTTSGLTATMNIHSITVNGTKTL